MELEITKKKLNNGFFGGPKAVSFDVIYHNEEYVITIEQCVIRKIRIVSKEHTSIKNLLSLFLSLEILLMLFDGQFYTTVMASDGTTDITDSINQQEAAFFHSADFMLGSNNTLIDFYKILNSDLFHKWLSLKDELDIIHNMYLYSVADIHLPIDIRCAQLVELFEGLAELIHNNYPEFLINPIQKENGKRESTLKFRLISTIEKFGLSLFSEELSCVKDELGTALVNTRNRIAHIKRKQKLPYLESNENLFYTIKLSILYRIVLFDLLGVIDEIDLDKLSRYVDKINNRIGLETFFEKLKIQTKNNDVSDQNT